MSRKIEKVIHGPSWVEVILGAVLAAALGVVLGAVVLIIKPIQVVKGGTKEKDLVPGAVYYREGSHDIAKAKQAAAKRKAFAAGQSVTVTKDEINVLVLAAPDPGTPATRAKPSEKAAPPPAAAAAGELLASGAPNFRIRDGAFQLSVPVTVNVAGLEQKFIVQAQGAFVKKGVEFVFDAETLYFGSCPVLRLPFVSGYVAKKVLWAMGLPEDIAAAWAKVASVAVEGNALKLTMP